MTPNEDIIRKIQKLLALGQSPNEAEANLAMARAQEMLAKHNLEFAMVNATHVAGGTVEAAPEKRERTKMSRSAKYQWQRELWEAIAKANFCWHSFIEVYEGKRGVGVRSKVPVKRHAILGKESNVIAVRLMGEYLEDTMERLVIDKGGFTNAERQSRGANSWKRGCADRLVERIQKQAEERKKEGDAARPANSTALVLRDIYHALNYDATYGKGAHARHLLQDAEWEAGQAERERVAEVARLKAEKDWLEYLANESPAEKKKRERAEEKERIAQEKRDARSWRTYRNERYREASKIDSSAYTAGAHAGNKISLGAQVSAPGKKDRSLG